MVKKGLSPQVEAFCQAMIVTNNGTRSAVEAGYAPAHAAVQASKMLRRPAVLARIEELRKIADAELGKQVKKRLPTLSRAWVVEKLMENAENALEARDRGAANRALELLGREVGAFVERKQIEVHDPLAGLDAARLRALLDDLEYATEQSDRTIDVTPNPQISETPAISTTYDEAVPEIVPDEGAGAAAGAPGAGAEGAAEPPARRVDGAGWSEAGTGSLGAPLQPTPLPPGSSIPAVPTDPGEEEI